VTGDTVYGMNSEDFEWDDPEEGLQDWFDDTYDNDRPEVWKLYTGVLTDVKMIEPEGSYLVEPSGSLEYLLVKVEDDAPTFILKEQ